MVTYNIELTETIAITDVTLSSQGICETVKLTESFIIILPKIALPNEVVDALRSHKTQAIYSVMQSMSMDIQKIRMVKEGDYVLAEDVENPKNAVKSGVSYLRELLKWEASTVADDISSLVNDAEQYANLVPEIRAGDLILPDHHNYLVKGIKSLFYAARKWFPHKLGLEILTNLIERSYNEIISPDDHNNKRRVLENIYNIGSRLSGVIVVFAEG